MKYRRLVGLLLIASFALNIGGCSLINLRETQVTEVTTVPSDTIEAPTLPPEETTEETVAPTPTPEPKPGINEAYIGKTPEEIVAMMTLEEKASQMVQGANYNLSRDMMAENCYGSVLSYNGNWPSTDVDRWYNITSNYQEAALSWPLHQ